MMQVNFKVRKIFEKKFKITHFLLVLIWFCLAATTTANVQVENDVDLDLDLQDLDFLENLEPEISETQLSSLDLAALDNSIEAYFQSKQNLTELESVSHFLGFPVEVQEPAFSRNVRASDFKTDSNKSNKKRRNSHRKRRKNSLKYKDGENDVNDKEKQQRNSYYRRSRNQQNDPSKDDNKTPKSSSLVLNADQQALLFSKVNTIESLFQNFQDALRKASNDIITNKRDISTLTSSLNQKTKTIEIFRSEISDLQYTIQRLSDNVDSAASERARIANILQNLGDETGRPNLISQAETIADSANMQLRSQIRILQNDMNQSKNDIRTSKIVLTKQKQAVKWLHGQQIRMQKNHNNTIENINLRIKRIESDVTGSRELSESVELLRDDLNNFKSRASGLYGSRNQLLDVIAKTSNIRNVVSTLSNSNGNLKSTVDTLRSDVQRLESKVNNSPDFDSRNSRSRSNFQDSYSRDQTVTIVEQLVNPRFNKLETANSDLNNRVKNFETTLATNQGYISDLNVKIRDANIKITNFDTELGQNRENIDKVDDKLTTLQATALKLSTSVNQVNAPDLVNRSIRLEQQINAMNNLKIQLNEHHTSILNINNLLKQLPSANEIQELKDQTGSYSGSINSLTNQNRNLDSTVQNIRQQLARFQTTFNNKLDNIHNENTNLVNLNNSLTNLENLITSLRINYRNVNQAIQDTNTDVNKNKNLIGQIQRSLSSDNQSGRSSNNDNDQVSSRQVGLINDRISSLENEMKELSPNNLASKNYVNVKFDDLEKQMTNSYWPGVVLDE